MRPPRSRGRRIRELAVVVPARDESALLDRCLDALLAARDRLAATHPDIDVRILVVADACADDTAERAEARRADGIDMTVTRAGRVGVARAVGVERVLGRRSRLAHLWLAHTDADSAVPVDWLSHQVELAEGGTTVFVGTVRPDPADLSPEQDAAWLAAHTRGRPNGHVHGASLGVLAADYVAVGGFDPVAEHEDNLLLDRLRATGATIVASDVAEVLTSGRRIGRTPGGYAAYLEQSLGPVLAEPAP